MKLHQRDEKTYTIQEGKSLIATATRKQPGWFLVKLTNKAAPFHARVRESFLDTELVEAVEARQ